MKKVLQKDRFLVLFKTVVYTSLLNAWFLFPCMFSMQHFDIRQPYRNLTRIQESGARLQELFAFWGDGNTNVKGIGFSLGLGLVLFLYLYSKWPDSMKKQGLFCFVMSGCVLFASTVYFPWNKLSALLGNHASMVNNIQFPTRLLGFAAALAMFCLCFTLQELVFHHFEKECRYVSIGLLVLGLIAAEYMIFTGNKLDDVRKVYDYAKLGRTDYCVGEYVYYAEDNNTPIDFVQNKLRINELIPDMITSSENVSYSEYEKKSTAISINCDNASDLEGYVELPLLFYEQYVAMADTGGRLQTQFGENHRLRVVIPALFSDTIVVDYVRPWWWRLCDFISLLSWIGFAIAIRKQND